jgi:hypothetical protein
MNGKILSGPAAVLVIVLFFLPWISVSCDDEPLGSFNGLQLATGTVPEGSDELLESSDLGGEPILFVVPLAGAISILLMAITFWKSSFEENAGWGRIIAALLGVLVLVLEWLQLQSQNDSRFEIVLEPAMWGTIAGLLFTGLGGLVDVLLFNRTPSYARSLGSRSTRAKQDYRPTIIARREDLQGQVAPGSHTILDDGLGGDAGYGSATILDDSFESHDPYGSATILDEDLAAPPQYEGATILDEDFVSGPSVDSGATILDEDLVRGSVQDSGATILDDELLGGSDAFDDGTILDEHLMSPGYDDDHTILSDRRGAPGSPAPPVPSPSPRKTRPPERTPEELEPTMMMDKTEVLRASPAVVAWLVITNGDRAGEQIQLGAETTIGRAPSNDIVLEDTALSGKHLMIKSDRGRYHAFDLQSTNGLFVLDETTSGWEKREQTELKHGAQIKLGRIILQLVVEGHR